ncbi:hypothetical protein ACTUVN_004605 [Pseudomonas caspiana]
MGWDRQPPQLAKTPAPLSLGRWVVAAAGTVLVGILLFLLHASEQLPQLQAFNIWALAASPLLICVLAFGARAYLYGGAVSHQQFLDEEAQAAQEAWADWGQRSMAVHASCVLLPDQVCASALVQGLPPRTGQARRILELPVSKQDRAQAALKLLLPALAPALEALPKEIELRLTLLSDVDPNQYDTLREALQRNWAGASPRSLPAMVSLADELSHQWIEDKLKSASPAFELLIVLQVQGEAAYSDGLAAMLLSSDHLAKALNIPVQSVLSRPMPLDIDKLDVELPVFLQTQTSALQATGLLADRAEWQKTMAKVMSASFVQGASLKPEQQWVMETVCGFPGPLSGWLATALAVETVRLQPQPLLALIKDQSQRWISTVTKGEGA